MIDDRVDRDGGLAGLAVADDEFALAAADRGHRVDGLDTGLQRLLDRLTTGDARSRVFQRSRGGRQDRTFAVERVAQRIDDSADERIADGNRQQRTGRADLVPFGDLQVVAEDDDADGVLFQVEDLPANAAGELDHFAGHGRRQAIAPSDAVAHFEYATDFGRFNLAAKVLNLLLDD